MPATPGPSFRSPITGMCGLPLAATTPTQHRLIGVMFGGGEFRLEVRVTALAIVYLTLHSQGYNP